MILLFIKERNSLHKVKQICNKNDSSEQQYTWLINDWRWTKAAKAAGSGRTPATLASPDKEKMPFTMLSVGLLVQEHKNYVWEEQTIATWSRRLSQWYAHDSKELFSKSNKSDELDVEVVAIKSHRPFCRKFFKPKTRMESDSFMEVVINFRWTQEWSQIAEQDLSNWLSRL